VFAMRNLRLRARTPRDVVVTWLLGKVIPVFDKSLINFPIVLCSENSQVFSYKISRSAWTHVVVAMKPVFPMFDLEPKLLSAEFNFHNAGSDG
jgi:hypothetical protein